jgi:hypothetical protein
MFSALDILLGIAGLLVAAGISAPFLLFGRLGWLGPRRASPARQFQRPVRELPRSASVARGLQKLPS